MLFQLHRVIVRLIDELANIGRIGLIEPLHGLSKLSRSISAGIVNAYVFGEVVASVSSMSGQSGGSRGRGDSPNIPLKERTRWTIPTTTNLAR